MGAEGLGGGVGRVGRGPVRRRRGEAYLVAGEFGVAGGRLWEAVPIPPSYNIDDTPN